MTATPHPRAGCRSKRSWRLSLTNAVLGATGCLAVTACASGASPASPGGPNGGAPAAIPAANRAAGQAFRTESRGSLVSMPELTSQSVVYTASLTVATAHPAAAAAQASRLATAAGGYVSGEQATLTGNPGRVSIDLKIPVPEYQSTLAALGRLGRVESQSEQAADVTQTVADVGSRVASAQAAISALRALLARSGTVTGLLSVQDQINSEEASLESLQAQQRALARQTAYATVALALAGPAHTTRKRPPAGGGFLAGLHGGWRALRAVGSALAEAAGAALPFALVLALLIVAVLRARNWRFRRRPGGSPAGPQT